jgi:hypothetical protein
MGARTRRVGGGRLARLLVCETVRLAAIAITAASGCELAAAAAHFLAEF